MSLVSVVLDPGHGGADLGASGGGLNEAQLVLSFCSQLREDMTRLRLPAAVALTRTTNDENPTFRNRNHTAKWANATLVLSVHANTSAPRGSQHGALVLHWPRNRHGEDVAEHIARSIPAPLYRSRFMTAAHAWPATPRKWPHAHRVISAYRATCVLVELGYLDHAGDADALSRSSVTMGLRAACLCGIARHIALTRGDGRLDSGL